MVRKTLRTLVAVVVLLVVPGANAIQMDCVPGFYRYYSGLGWRCMFWVEATHCMICSAEITVQG
jgi:hypothetical protein